MRTVTESVHQAALATGLTREGVLATVAVAAAVLLKNGQTTERVVLAAERLGRALGLPLKVHPHWGELAVHVEGTPFSEMIPATPLAVDMGKVLAGTKIVDDVCGGRMSGMAARAALEAIERLPPASTARFILFAALGGSSLGVIFGTLDLASLLLIALAAGSGAVLRRGLASLGQNPFAQPLCAATLAGVIGALATRFHLAEAPDLVTLCPGMVLIPGPHILNGAIDFARARIVLGMARLAYSGLTVLMICTGLLVGLTVGGEALPVATSSLAVPLGLDVVAAGFAVAAFGTFFSMPWRLLPVPIALGIVAHAARWALISVAGAPVAAGALGACILAGVLVTPIVDRLHLPFAALAFCAVVSMMPGVFLFRAADGLVRLVSAGDSAPTEMLADTVANGVTAFLVIVAMTFGLILPRMLFERFLRQPGRPQ